MLLLLFFAAVYFQNDQGQVVNPSTGQLVQPQVQPEPLLPRNQIQQNEQQSQQNVNQALQARQQQLIPSSRSSYTFPGLVVIGQDGNIGTPHLYNLTSHIEIVVTVDKKPEVDYAVDEQALYDVIVEEFKKVYIEPGAMPQAGNPYLPMFNLLVMITPINRGYALFVTGRLFESVEMDRIRLEPNTAFQAITWQSQFLDTVPTETVGEYLKRGARDIARGFTEQFAYYDDLKVRTIRKRLSE